ncbi:MAG: HEAT repeat domain-containing protein [Planctomycetota bacterium]
MKLHCNCGADFALPAHMMGRRLHCRACRAPLASPVIDNLLDAWTLLGDMSDDTVTYERECVARELPLTEDARAAAILAKLLCDEADEVAATAETSLRRFPRELVARRVAETLQGTAATHAGRLLVVFARLRPQEADRQALQRIFDADASVRAAAVRVVGLTGNRDASETVKRALEFDAPIVALAAARTLWSFDNRIGASKVKRLLKSHEAGVRADAARTVGELGFPPFLGLLKRPARDADSAVRKAVASALAGAAEPVALSILKGLARDEEEAVRSAAARALGKGASPKGLKMLLDLARKDPSVHVRRSAAEALALRKDEAASSFIEGALQDADPGVRSIAALHAAATPRAGLYDLLRELLRADDPFVRRNALVALSILGGETLRHELVRNASDTDPSPRAAAAALLARRTEKRQSS